MFLKIYLFANEKLKLKSKHTKTIRFILKFASMFYIIMTVVPNVPNFQNLQRTLISQVINKVETF